MPDQSPFLRGSLLVRQGNFRRYWLGQTLSVFGTQVTAVALPLVAVITMHAGAKAVGLIATAAFLPNAIFPLFVGNWLDGRQLRPVMILADLVRAAALLLVPLAYLGHFLSLQLLVAVAFVVGTASVAFDIGSFALIPSLVEEPELGGANQAVQGSMTMAQVAGPGLAGTLTQLIGPAMAIVVDVASYFASVLGIYTSGRAERPPPDRAASKVPVLDGIRQLLGNRYLRALTVHAASYNVAAQVITVNLVVWMVHDRHTGAGIYGAALSAAGAGAFLGTMLVLRLYRRIGFGNAYLVALVLFTGTPLALAPLPMSGVALGYAVGTIQLIAGLGLGAANVLSTTLRQSAVPRGSLVRSVGSYRLLIYGTIPIGSGLGGLLGSTLGSRTAVAIGSLGMLASALPMAAKQVRGLRVVAEARPAEPAVPAPPEVDLLQGSS